MKLTKERLKQIINEEMDKIQELGGQFDFPKGPDRATMLSDINNILDRLNDHSLSVVLRYLIEMMPNLDLRKNENKEDK